MNDTRSGRSEGARRSSRRGLGILATVGASALLALGVATPASAHDSLETAAPAADSTVTETLSTVALGFSEELLVLGEDMGAFAIQVTDGDDRHYESGCVGVDGATATTEVASGPAGEYEVAWQVVSSDGHPTSGSYTFTYQPAEPGEQSNHTIAPLCGDAWAGTPSDDEVPLPALTPDPNAPAETPVPEASEGQPAGGDAPTASETPAASDAPATEDTPAASDGDDTEAASSTVPLWAIVLGGLAAIGLIAAVIVLTLRRSRRLPGEGNGTDSTA